MHVKSIYVCLKCGPLIGLEIYIYDCGSMRTYLNYISVKDSSNLVTLILVFSCILSRRVYLSSMELSYIL